MKNRLIKRRERIKQRVRSKIVRRSEHPRISVYRSNSHIYAQVIDDFKMQTLAAASDAKLGSEKMNRIEKARTVGRELAEIMKKKHIKQAVFDRGCYPYKGRVKVLAEAVREAGVTI
ncbi:50S ribosomal protein L18 [Candidatus Roizmanbacteria bacterium RIFCSPLOWO2_01_FULL_42_14]|uniref:Large ribosomal subunit protein uL18 n=4 Tax=Candidatus Roizmaniibacteriota TaxID=1752723 RepID=A0A1F7JUZ4_9BACT|nr:MAG: 50S ribosomal protein L18 [Candidatus Roizmanbacteria bacterium RIFCSPHIGHO2_02_FULL_43_11]OGK38609.1 MAG: 50S ribosomal protein L18 [Candidatus Roizmanbacteria bacterium RIFCSPHIGHO2_12_FULL_42_10]OGK52203.1 MAG: 50S ribosomal protein L18 [Candidatus Roizmanbacteria bacterium RIFCSPLOWO2_01_FULL_42_14]OGK59436.1 MAG: 50S ribosomal protein L18 [Candidatus Roizmanbacteria bacterium RIFCSPLOWO2_02_FULL_43_10]